MAYRPGKSLKFHRDGDRSLQLLVLNEEFLVSTSHQFALTTYDIFYNVELILKYNDDKTFFEEQKNYLQIKDGLYYYLKERNINFNGNKTQKIYQKDKKEIRSIININSNEKPKVNENLINFDKKSNINEINNKNKENKAMIKEKDKNIISFSEYIKALFLSLLKIKELKNRFINKNLSTPKKASFSYN